MSSGLMFALVCAVIAVLYGAGMTKWILSLPAGNPRMQEIKHKVAVLFSLYYIESRSNMVVFQRRFVIVINCPLKSRFYKEHVI